MSRFSLRDISGNLAGAPDLESAIDTLLGYLRALQPDWYPSVAMFDSERECFERVYQRPRGRLERRDLVLGVDYLPARLVRKFIRPSAFFNGENRRSLLEKLFQTSPGYEPDRFEAQQLQPLTPPVGWRSCVCLPLNDREELIGMIVIVSARTSAFGPKVTEELQPLRGLASLSIARRLHMVGRPTPESRDADRAVVGLQQRLATMQAELDRTRHDGDDRTHAMHSLATEAETLRAAAAEHENERLELVRQARLLEEQVAAVGQNLQETHLRLTDAQALAEDLNETLDVVREAFEVMAGDIDADTVTRAFVAWFCERFQIERCSLMRVDDAAGDLRILAHRGMDPALVPQVRLPMGHGVAGWVASHRQSVMMREGEGDSPVQPTGLDHYNSGSFISVPLVHQKRVIGVLNLSNKQDGVDFDELDFDRAKLASGVLAMALGGGPVWRGVGGS